MIKVHDTVPCESRLISKTRRELQIVSTKHFARSHWQTTILARWSGLREQHSLDVVRVKRFVHGKFPRQENTNSSEVLLQTSAIPWNVLLLGHVLTGNVLLICVSRTLKACNYFNNLCVCVCVRVRARARACVSVRVVAQDLQITTHA
jgi:hypothetical protein